MPTNVRVGPDVKLGTHDVMLFDGVESWGIRLVDGPRGIQEIPTEQVTERPHNLLQRDWVGGRGLKRFKDDPSRFGDSREVWSVTPGRIAPAPEWSFASGIHTAHDGSLVGNTEFINPRQHMGKADLAFAWPFTTTSSMTPDRILFRAIEPIPGDIGGNVKIELSSGSLPDATKVYFTANASDAEPNMSGMIVLDDTGSASSMAAGDYWVYFDLKAGSRLGVDITSTGARQRQYSGTWGTFDEPGALRFRLETAPTERKMHFFELYGQLYMADQKDAGSTSQLWMNGERGKAVGCSGAAATELIDTSFGIQGSSWAADTWINYRVKIVSGAGQGQNRLITDSDSNTLTVSPAWAETPTSASDYVIYGGPAWQQLPAGAGSTAGSTAGPGMGTRSVSDVTVSYNCARLAMSGTNLIRMAYDSTNADHKWAEDENGCDFVHSFQNPDGKWKTYTWATTDTIWAANSSVGYDDSTFVEQGGVGGTEYDVTALTDYDGKLYIMKEDSIWYYMGSTGTFHRLNVGLESMPNSNNGASPAASDMFLYFPWAFSMERFYGGTLDDIGPWKGEGLPEERKGVVSAIEPAFGWLFVGIDAGSSGYSSVLLWNQRGYHEIFRGWKGARVRDLYFQGVEDGNPILWINCGGELVYMKFPRHSLNPLQESAFDVQPSATIESAEIQYDDEGTPTFYKELTVFSENLNSSAWIEVDYQYNEDVGSTTWLSADAIYESPQGTVPLNIGEAYNFKYRLRLITQDADQIPIVDTVEIKAFARRPIRYQWNMRARVSDLQRTYRGGKDHDPNRFISFLKDAASKAKNVFVRSKWPQFDDTWVVVDPPTVLRTYTTDIPKHQEGGVIPFSVREG